MVVKNHILVIEDDEDIAHNIKYNLEREAPFDVKVALSGEDGFELCELQEWALFIIDVNLPGMSGFELCHRLRRRSHTAHIPIIILSARASEDDKVYGFDLGADDYVTKPFSMRELKARVSALLKHRSQSPAPYDDGRLFIDFEQMIVRFEGRIVTLTQKQFRLLRVMVENCGRLFTREMLLERVWGLNYLGESRTIDVHISRLRQKLGGEDYIQTIVGLGYRFKEKSLNHEEDGGREEVE
jgi:two-component system, OmpR family, alkaline phosphatase synthesis response regulator PhoP